MPSTNPSVYIIVLNYCSLDDSIKCIHSIRESSYNNQSLLVIDNDSPDSSGITLQNSVLTSEFIQLNKNIGYAGGNNIGIHHALNRGADYIFIVNPDIRLPPNAIDTYVNIMLEDPTIYALNPLQLTEHNELDSKFENAIFTQNNHPPPKPSSLGSNTWQVKTLFGAALFISRHAIEKTGGFDPLFFAYWEEIDLCRRFKINGGKLIVTEQEPVIHLRTKENNSDPDDFILFLRLKGMYLDKLKNPDLNLISSLNQITRECIHYLHNDFIGMFSWKRKHFLKSLIWIYTNLPSIIHHRHIEKKPGPLYLPLSQKE